MLAIYRMQRHLIYMQEHNLLPFGRKDCINIMSSLKVMEFNNVNGFKKSGLVVACTQETIDVNMMSGHVNMTSDHVNVTLISRRLPFHVCHFVTWAHNGCQIWP